jgi:hypothetical protein
MPPLARKGASAARRAAAAGPPQAAAPQDILPAAPRASRVGPVEFTERTQVLVVGVFVGLLLLLLLYANLAALKRTLLRPAWECLDAWWNPLPELQAPPAAPTAEAAAPPPPPLQKQQPKPAKGKGSKARGGGGGGGGGGKAPAGTGQSAASSGSKGSAAAPAPVPAQAAQAAWEEWPEGAFGEGVAEEAAEEDSGVPWEVVGGGGGSRERAASTAFSVDSQPPELLGPEGEDAAAAAAEAEEPLCPCCGYGISQEPPVLQDCAGRAANPARLVYDSDFGLLPYRDLVALRASQAEDL